MECIRGCHESAFRSFEDLLSSYSRIKYAPQIQEKQMNGWMRVTDSLHVSDEIALKE